MSNSLSSEDKLDERSIRTRAKLLDAAERLFAERGFKGASMRDITTLADVNIAAANYHFGGKEGLFREVLRRYAEEIISRRAAFVKRAEESGTIESLVEAIVLPSFEYLAENPESAIYISRLMARIPHEVPEVAFPIFGEYFLPSLKELENKIQLKVPELSQQDFDWLIHCLRAMFFQSVSTCAIVSKWQKFYVTVIPPAEAAKRIVCSFMTLLDKYKNNKD